MDKASLIGLVLGLAAIFGGNVLEGGKLSQVLQPIAFIIVGGGTVGATLLQFPMGTFVGAMKGFKSVMSPPPSRIPRLIEEIVGYATTARRDGILALESLAPKASDPFLSRALMMAVDGADSTQMRESLESTISHVEEAGEDQAKVWEAIGGYAPTVGIIGAVLGLIQVMQNLSDIEKVGHGIASAFVATIYGVAIANLIALPAAGKLKLRTRDEVATLTLALEGALAIQQGVNPKLLRDRLIGMAGDHAAEGHEAPAGAPERAAA
ncbi:MAG: flagellar motor protein [Polyangiaceae bacterium]|nr:flagellar motor protein [Polyangiaceae bacterium]